MNYRITLTKEQHGDTIRLEKMVVDGSGKEISECVDTLAIIRNGREVFEVLNIFVATCVKNGIITAPFRFKPYTMEAK